MIIIHTIWSIWEWTGGCLKWLEWKFRVETCHGSLLLPRFLWLPTRAWWRLFTTQDNEDGWDNCCTLISVEGRGGGTVTLYANQDPTYAYFISGIFWCCFKVGQSLRGLRYVWECDLLWKNSQASAFSGGKMEALSFLQGSCYNQPQECILRANLP